MKLQAKSELEIDKNLTKMKSILHRNSKEYTRISFRIPQKSLKNVQIFQKCTHSRTCLDRRFLAPLASLAVENIEKGFVSHESEYKINYKNMTMAWLVSAKISWQNSSKIVPTFSYQQLVVIEAANLKELRSKVHKLSKCGNVRKLLIEGGLDKDSNAPIACKIPQIQPVSINFEVLPLVKIAQNLAQKSWFANLNSKRRWVKNDLIFSQDLQKF